MSITTVINDVIHRISDHGDAILSKFVYHFGAWVGVGGGAVTYATKKTVEPDTHNVVAQFVLNYGSLISMIAASMLIIKTGYDIYLNHQDNKRKQQAHDKAMSNNE